VKRKRSLKAAAKKWPFIDRPAVGSMKDDLGKVKKINYTVAGRKKRAGEESR